MSVPGRTAKHTWTDVNGNTVTLNDHATPLGTQARLWVNNIAGFYSTADLEPKTERRRSRPGEIPRRSTRGGKSLVYEGHIESFDYNALDAARSKIINSFNDEEPGEVVIVPGSGHPGPSYSYKATATQAEVGDKLLGASPLRVAFTVGLRMHDSRFFEVTEQSLETGFLVSHAGLTLPWSFTTQTPNWSTQSRIVSVPYQGTAAGDPVLDLYGPVTSPRVANELTKTGLRFHPDMVIADGQFMRIDFRTREVLLNGTSDYDPLRRADLSDWWDAGVPGLVPGVTQTLRYGAKGGPAKMIVRWRNARHG